MKPVQVIILVIAVIIVCVGGTSFYFMNNNPVAASANPGASKALVEKAIKGKGAILNTFKMGALNGYVVKGTGANSQEGILFTDVTGQYLITGNVLNSDLKSMTQQAFEKYITPAKAKKAYDTISTTATVTDGKDSAPHKLYVIADPNCIFCHRFYEVSKPLVESGQLQIRWIIGAFLKPSSKGKAAAILGAKDPLSAFVENENKFNDSSEEGGITAMSKIPDDVMNKLKANMQFMMTNRIMQTPTLIYKNAQGTPKMFSGVPNKDQLKVMVNSMSSSF